MAAPSPQEAGQRIAGRRRQLGMSRRVLAELSGRSSEWLRQVENGTRDLDSIRVAQRIAEILGYDRIDDIIGGGTWSSDPQADTAVISQALRLEAVSPVWLSDSDSGNMDVPTELDRLRQVWWHAPYRIAEMDRSLLQLIPLARQQHHELTPMESAAEAAHVDVLSLARSFLTFAGERHLALIMAERAAAQTSPASLLTGSVAVRGLALCYLQNKQARLALALAVAQAKRLDDASLAVRGSLLSVAAKAAAQLSDYRQAALLIGQAQTAAGALGRDGHERGIWFGPTDIALTGMAVAWSAGEYDQILDIAEHLRLPAGFPAHLRIPFHAMLAALYARRRDIGTAMVELREVERLSPEAIVHSPMARAALRSLSGARHPLLGRDLRRMSEIAGV